MDNVKVYFTDEGVERLIPVTATLLIKGEALIGGSRAPDRREPNWAVLLPGYKVEGVVGGGFVAQKRR